MGGAGSGRSSQGHKEPFRVARGGWGSAWCCGTSPCTAGSTGVQLGSVCPLCQQLNHLW